MKSYQFGAWSILEITWLQTFLVAAEEGNFHRTAERLHIAQPTVSLHIRKLEEVWGVELFQRTGRNVELSAAGRRGVKHARNVYDAYVTSQEELSRFSESYDETIVVATSPIVALTFLSRWIRRMHQTHPNIQFTLRVVDSDDVCKLVESHEADIGFSRIPSSSRLIEGKILYEDPVRLVVPAWDQDHDGSTVTVDDIMERYPIVTHNHPLFWDDLVTALRNRFKPLRTMRVSQTHVTLHFVEQGLAASFLPVSLTRQSLILGRIMEVDVPDMSLPTTHTYLLTRDMRSAVSDFVQCVEDYMQAHAG
ncbi:LysR family transcriptional regulator [Alicyclobacillus dauci]|uniref:LysR family transcriptional regulator n=1 Tax=Alicyclobacillus dauci TaxID=1475485 RepID=A0ABY6Z6W6_9BACL|nr:LysR family transcriptional regulator [Alicyclobacillus dauci]WAH38529.1 LysR family transcriptional regulator [Alicyclobacillus dauci]